MGTLTLAEFEKHLQDDDVRAYFASLELEVSDAWTLFKLLDTEGLCEISIEDFVVGCLKLRGQARSIDLAIMMYEHKWMMNRLTTFMGLVENETLSVLHSAPLVAKMVEDTQSIRLS